MSTDHVKTPGTEADEVPDRALLPAEDQDRGNEEDHCREIVERFGTMYSFWSRIHQVGLEDDKFVAGEQWPQQIKNEREEERRPVLTYNLMPSFNRQITNKMRQDDRSLAVTPVETNRGADPRITNLAGTKDYSLADIYAGIWKNIEHVSRADQCYDTAAKHAVDHGFGFFYLMPQWSKIDPFVQELVLHRVKNSYSVLLDPDAQEADYRDAQDGFLFTDIGKNTFRRKYPDAKRAEFAAPGSGSIYEGWFNSDSIRIAQYMWVDYQDDEVLMLSNGKTVYLSDVEAVLDDLEEETGVHIAKNDAGNELRKKVKRPVCMWQKMTANEILEGPIELPFSGVPIFPVLGEEMLVDGEVRYESAIRHAKDAQRSYNYWRTAAAETVALAPRAPWLLTEAQLAGHEDLFEAANNSNLPYLTYNFKEGHPLPQRQFPSAVAAAELQNATQDGIDMQTIIGLHDASLGRESNEKSGKAIIARKEQGDNSTFQFPDNLSRAMEQAGRRAVEAIPRLFDSRRIIRIRLPDDSNDFIEINQAVTDGETGQELLVHDIAYGKYDVRLETGPGYATQRQEAADLQIELLKVLGPDRAANIVHLIVQNLGVPGSEEVARVLRKMLPDQLKSEEEKLADLPPGVIKDPETGQLVDEEGKPWQPQPTLEQQIAMKQQEIDELEHQAEIAKHKATSDQAAAKTKQAEADLAEANAELAKLQASAAGQGEEAVPGTAEVMAQIKEIVDQAMREHSADPSAHDAMDLEGKIADAIVDALKRVRAYVDRQVAAGNLSPANEDELSGSE